MGEFPQASRKNDNRTAPRANTANGPQGQVAVLAVSAVAIAVDLSQGVSQPSKNLLFSGQDPKTPTRNALSITSDVDIGIIFGPTLASVSGGNAPVIANNGTLTGNTYTGAAGTCWLVKAANGNTDAVRFILQPGQDVFMGVVGSGAGKVRFYQSSPDDA